MKIIIQLLVSAFCGFGLGFILSDVFRIPKYPVSKAIKSLGKRKNKQISRLEIWLGDFSNLIASKLRLNEYKRLQLKADLESADMTLSPEQYVGNAIVKSVLVAVLAIPFLFFAPLISLVMIIIAIAVYVGEYGKVGRRLFAILSRLRRAVILRFVAVLVFVSIQSRLHFLQFVVELVKSFGDFLQELSFTRNGYRRHGKRHKQQRSPAV